MTEIQNRMLELLESGKHLLDREDACRMSLLALIAGESIFLYGPPGTAKSMTAKWAASLLDTKKYFSCLLNQYTQPDELFGPVNIQALGNGQREILTDGYMPESEIAFLDEIWKSGPAILNTLLTICNEKTFRNGKSTINVPLKLLISASNEFPSEDSGLEPLYDRFLIRLEVNPVSRKDSFVKLVTGESESLKSEFKAISEDELLQYQKGSESVNVPKVITDFLYSLRLRLNERGIYISDRRWKKSVGLLKTSAFLNGRISVGYSDLFILENVLWSRLEEKSIIRDCAIESVTKETVKGSFSFTERILSEIGKLAAFESTSSEKYSELSKMIDAEISYLGSLKKELEVARSGGENFWKNIFSGLNTEFELDMMNKGIDMLREFISDAESGLEGLQFSKRPEVKQTISEMGKNGEPPTVILTKDEPIPTEQNLQIQSERQERKDDFIDIDEITKIHKENDESNSSESQNVPENKTQTENFESSQIQVESELNTVSQEISNAQNEQENQFPQTENSDSNQNENKSDEEYEMILSRIKTFDDLVEISKYPYTGDSSDKRYLWNENQNNGAKWWNVGSRFYNMFKGDRNTLSVIEAECLKRGVKIGGKYHWVFSVCYIFEKNDGVYNKKTIAELKWLLGAAWQFLEPVFEEALS